MRLLIAIGVLLATTAACGGNRSATSPDFVESPSCRTAAAPLGEMANLTVREADQGKLLAHAVRVRGDAFSAAQDQVTAACSAGLSRSLAFASYRLAVVATELQLCDTRPETCDPAQNATDLASATTALKKFLKKADARK